MAGSDEIMAVILTYINYSDYASVCLALFAFAVGLVIDLWRKTGTPLHEHLGRAIAAGAVPSALVLICGAFDPSVLMKVAGLNVPIAFGGMSLLYVSFKAVIARPSKGRERRRTRRTIELIESPTFLGAGAAHHRRLESRAR